MRTAGDNEKNMWITAATTGKTEREGTAGQEEKKTAGTEKEQQEMGKRRISLETLAGGEAADRVDEALMDAVVNMMDPGTDAKKKRRVSIVIDLVPDERRRVAGASVSVTAKLVPHGPAKTSLLMDVSPSGEIGVTEYGSQIPGQMDLADYGEAENRGPRGFDAATGEILEGTGDGNIVNIGRTAAQ